MLSLISKKKVVMKGDHKKVENFRNHEQEEKLQKKQTKKLKD